jgi:hypothetical protein
METILICVVVGLLFKLESLWHELQDYKDRELAAKWNDKRED